MLYIDAKMKLSFTIHSISLTSSLKRKSPRTDPWGTPQLMLASSDICYVDIVLYIDAKMKLSFTIHSISLTSSLKRKSPRTDPWGTPQLMLASSDICWPYRAVCVRFFKYNENQSLSKISCYFVWHQQCPTLHVESE